MLSAAHILLALFGGAFAGAPPVFPAVTDLHIRNAFAAPDGFNRSFVTAEGILPGPTITGNKVRSSPCAFIWEYR